MFFLRPETRLSLALNYSYVLLILIFLHKSVSKFDSKKSIIFFNFFQEKTGECLTDEEKEMRRERIARMRRKMTTKHKLVAHSTAMESIQAQTDPIDGEDNLPFVLFLRSFYLGLFLCLSSKFVLQYFLT